MTSVLYRLDSRIARTFLKILKCVEALKNNAMMGNRWIQESMTNLRVLIGCEFSGITRDAFLARGHDAISCDLLPTEQPGPHYQGDIFDIIGDGFDLAIFHPPCTHLSLSGARWCTDHWVKNKKGDWWHDGSEKRRQRAKAVEFFRSLLECPIPKICIENPMSMASTLVAPFTQRIQPWQFGHGVRKETWLWLKNLPPLVPTNIVDGREPACWNMTPSADRGHKRSISYEGISKAMAAQWG